MAKSAQTHSKTRRSQGAAPKVAAPAANRRKTTGGVTGASPSRKRTTSSSGPAAATIAGTSNEGRHSSRIEERGGRPDYQRLQQGRSPATKSSVRKTAAALQKPANKIGKAPSGVQKVTQPEAKGQKAASARQPKKPKKRSTTTVLPTTRYDWRGIVPVIGPLIWAYEAASEALVSLLSVRNVHTSSHSLGRRRTT
eukprot:TRINITY_DN24124_c0_g1_i1.p1 TRINITY_DN24124_c0_g1~~TRINITY_DN24124_c0_g1_i1.p1  ORF type:complete len:196 (-),score=10.42 TRINITY_DN24124_c0_g1_i1:214-801(-)